MRRLILVIVACILAAVGFSFAVVYRFKDNLDKVLQQTEQSETVQAETEAQTQMAVPETEPQLPIEPETEPETEAETEDPALHAEDSIYTFMQGPVAWESKAPYSGSWCESELDGGTFSVFGCGHCVIAGIYSSLTPYECSPLDMYALARKVTDYSPSPGYGAIDWPFMVQTLEKTGITAAAYKKPRSYKAFQKAIASSLGAVALISSDSDDTYWQDTPGHYVSLWHYNPETDKIFLGDSGNPKHNRKWIPLRYIYDALGKNNAYQYMLVTNYDEEKNEWKYSGIVEKWTRPSWCTPKPKHESLLKQKELEEAQAESETETAVQEAAETTPDTAEAAPDAESPVSDDN